MYARIVVHLMLIMHINGEFVGYGLQEDKVRYGTIQLPLAEQDIQIVLAVSCSTAVLATYSTENCTDTRDYGTIFSKRNSQDFTHNLQICANVVVLCTVQ